MANSDKDIRVVPNRNKSGLPNIAFTGYNNDPIVLNVLDDNTISFEGSSGQLFSVSNAVTTGTIFSVNDISGIPSFRVDADGTVGIAEFSGNVGIGLQSPQSKLSVGGDINVGAGYTFRVAGTKVLDSSSLGTGVTGSSLTSVGTISSGTWQGTAIGVNYGGTGATNASDSRSFLGAATAGTNSDITRLLGVQHLFVTIPTAAAIGITVKAATSQSASMMEFVNSSNSVMSWITKDGTFSHGAYFTHSDGRVPGFSVQRVNAAGIVARGFNSNNFAAIEVQNNPGSLTVGLYPSGLVYGGVLQAYSSTASTNTTTGALIVAGGVGIAGTTNFGRDVRIFSSLASSSPFTGALVVSGGVGISNNLFVGGGVAFTSSVASTSTTSGTLIVTGGVGIGGSVFTSTSNASSISGVVLSNGSVTLTGTYTQSNSSTTAFQVRDGSNNPAFVIDTIGDIISLPVAVASTSTSSGSLVVAGGVGIGGTLNARSVYVDNDLMHIPGTGNTFGMSFTSFTLPTGFTGSGLYAIYAENKFVATGGSVVAYSNDLINWTTSYIPWNASVYNQSITYGNGIYVVTSSVNSYVAYSRDLSTWTLASVQYQNYLTAAYGNGRFVINAGGVVGISTNGANWSSLAPTGSGPHHQALKFQNGYFYSSSSRSVDGIAWEPLNISISVGNISYGNGLYFGAQYNSSNYAYSYDGVNFTAATIANNVYVGTDYHNGVYYLRTQHNNAFLYYSTDGLNYQGIGFGGVGQFAMAFGKNKIVIFGRDGGSNVFGYYAEGTNGKIDLNPIREGNIDNTVIGSRTPKPANFTDLSITGYANIVNRANSTSTTSGALVVRGGVGIGQSVNIGGKLDVFNTINYTATNSGIANTWTRIAIPSPVSISGLTYGNGLYVGVGYSAATSTDGITWTARSLPHNLTGVGYGNGLYVGVLSGSALGATSTDGVTWRSMSLPGSTSWFKVAYGNGIYVASSDSTTVAYSYNGFQWTSTSLFWPGGYLQLAPVEFGGGYFIIKSNASSSYWISVDGINWTRRTNFTTGNVATNSVAYGDGTWVLAGSSASLAYTKDLLTFTYSGHYGYSGYANNIAYTNGTFAIVDANSLQCTLIYKNLTSINASYLPGPIAATTITAGEGKFVAGAGSTVYVTDIASHTFNIFPHNSGEINNVRIGAKYPASAQFSHLNANNLVSFGSSSPSTSTTTGALVVVGGVGIGGSLFVGNTLSVASSTASTSTTTGALIVSGGVGIGGSFNAGGVVRSGQLIAPTFTLSALGNTGALSPSTTYYYKLSSLDYFGNESLPSNEASIALNSSTYAVNINPNIDQSIYAIKIYRTTTSNSYTNSLVDTYYPFRGAYNASNIPYNYYDRGKSTSSSSPVTVSTANRAVLGSSINSTLGKLNLAGQLLIQSKNASAPSANIGIQLGNYDIAAVKDGLLANINSITSATGGTLTAGTTYYYIMTGVDGYGNETFPSKEFPFLADANGAAQMNIYGGDYGIIKYIFYRTTNPGNYTNCFIGELPDFKDINYPTQNVSPPTSSSANAYVLKSTPAENIPSYIDSLDIRPGLSGAVRKLADNAYNTISGIVTSGIAGTLAQNTNYFYKVASYDRYGNTSSASSPYIINTGPATSIQITPMGVDWPAGVEGFLVYRSTSKNNFTNVPTFYAYPGTAITDTGNYEFISSAPTYNNYLLGNFGGYYYGYANFYVRSIDIASGGNQSSMNFLSGRSPQPTITADTGGALTPGDVYYYKVMAFGRGDDISMASPAVRFVIGAGGAARISVDSINITGFRHYNIYRTADLSNWTNSQIARYVSESVFVDIGYPGTPGNPTGHAGLKRGTSATISDGAITALSARINSLTQDIAAPGGINISGTTGGILTTNTTYYYRIMAVGINWNEFGQASKQVTYTTSATQNAISLSWSLVPNATGYRVLRSTTNNAGAGQTYTFVHGTSFVDKGYATSQHYNDPYALYYPGSYGATISASWNRYHLPFLNITNGENPALTVSMLPPIISSTSTGTGGTLANNTNYYYIVEAYDYNGGSSLPSTEVVVNTGANNSVTLTWTEKNGAFYHKVYRSSNSDFTNKQINQTVYTNTFTDINYPTVNTSPRYSSTNGSMYRIGTVNTSGTYHGLFSRSVFQTTPTPQGAYGTDYAVRVAGRPASSIYGALFELGDFASTGYNGSSYGTYFGLSSATGFTGNYIDLQLSSISRFKVDYLGNATIGSTTGSGSTSTGALVISGGVGIGQSLFTSPSYSSSISGAIFSNGSATLSGTFTQNNSSTTAFQVRDGSNNPAFVIDTIADIVSLPVAVASTSTGTGSLVIAGGVGIGGTLNVGSVNVINNINYYPSTGSTGGIAWSTISLPAGVSGITKMIYANNKFVGVGNTFAVYSNDGLNWSSVNFTGFSSSENFNNLAFGSGKYVALAGSAATVALYSTDAITWTRSFLPASRVVFRGFAYGNGYFVGIDQSNIPVRSTDGINWTSASGLAGYSRDVKFINGQFIAILWLATNEDFTYTSTDGVDWARLSIPLVISYGITYGNGKYLASSIGTTSPIVSTDLVNWTRLVKPAPYYDQLYTPSYHNGTFYIPNNFNQIIYSNDLVNWSGVNAPSNELVYGADKLIIANGTSVLVSQSAQGKADISPFLNSSIENIRIGADNPDSATFTHLSALNNVSFTSPLNSTSTTTGALVVKGGVGIGGSINIGGRVGIGTNLLTGQINIQNPTASTPSIVIQGATSQSEDYLRVMSSTGVTSFLLNSSYQFAWPSIGTLKVYGTSYSSTGRLQVDGCLSVGTGPFIVNTGGGESSLTSETLTLGGAISWTRYTGTTMSTGNPVRIGPLSSYSYGLWINGENGWTSGNLLRITNNGNSVFNVDYAGTTSIASTTTSTSTTTGALVVTGGVGIGGTLNISGNASIGGTLNVSGSNSYFQNNLYVGNNTQGRLYFSQATLGSAGTTVIPTMAFIGATNSPITLSVLPDNSLSFDGSSGQLFSINNNLSTGWIFSINDISGLPIFRTNADLTVAMGEYGGNVGIGLSNPTFKLQVSGNAGISGTTLISNTTTSTNTTSGALVVSGGVGIGGSLNVTSASTISGVVLSNGAITNTGTITSTGVMTLSNSSTTAFQVRDGSNNPAFTIDTIGDIITLPVAIASTSIGTGSLVVSGGVGIGQSVSVGGRLQLFNSTNYTAFVSSASGNTVYTLPDTSPATGSSVLQSTSAGVMSWVPLAAGSGTVSTLTAGTGISFSTGATITTTGTIRARRPLVTSFCAGYTPAASGADSVVIRLPDSPSDGTTAITYEPQEFHIRVETASATTTTIQLEKYTGTGAFSGTAITSVSISGGSTYEAQTSVFAGAGIFLTSGDKLRINFTALSASHANFSVYLELEEV